jgi:hypothetical protein
MKNQLAKEIYILFKVMGLEVEEMKRKILVTLAIALVLLATLSLPAVAVTEQEVTASVTVTEYISITIADAPTAGIHFGSLALGTSNNPDTDANVTTPSITVTVDIGSNANVDLQIKGTDFNASTFPVTNAKYSLTYGGTKAPLSTSYATFAPNIVPGGTASIWHWLDVPSSGVTAGGYSSTFSYKAI